MTITLRQLEYLEAVGEALHFGQAARRCGVSQPALSIQIQQLEQSLGLRLLERGSRQVLLTPQGKEILGRTKIILRGLKDIETFAHQAQLPLHGSVRMGVIPTIAPYLLPKVLPGVKEQFPSLKLYLLEDQTLRLIRQLEEGRLDVLLLALPVDAPGTVARELFKEHFVVALPEDHPLAEQTTVTKDDLEKHTLLLLEDGHCLRDQALDVCKQGQATGDDIIKATSLSTLVEMVAGGLGITLVPEMAAPVEDAAHKRLALRPFSDPQPWRSVGLVWREQSGNQKELRMLGDFLQDLTTGLLQKSRSAHLKTLRPI